MNNMLVKRVLTKAALGAATVILPVAFFQANTTVAKADEQCPAYCCAVNDDSYCATWYSDALYCRSPGSIGGGITWCCQQYIWYCCMQGSGSCLT
jgi:hypothetical protein